MTDEKTEEKKDAERKDEKEGKTYDGGPIPKSSKSSSSKED